MEFTTADDSHLGNVENTADDSPQGSVEKIVVEEDAGNYWQNNAVNQDNTAAFLLHAVSVLPSFVASVLHAVFLVLFSSPPILLPYTFFLLLLLPIFP